jgi:hypothetical protein
MLPIQKFSRFTSNTIQNENEPKLEERQYATAPPIAQGIAMAKDSFEVEVRDPIPMDRASDRVQKKINEEEHAIKSQAVTDDSDSETSETRRRRGLENIQKLLDILRGINPQI